VRLEGVEGPSTSHPQASRLNPQRQRAVTCSVAVQDDGLIGRTIGTALAVHDHMVARPVDVSCAPQHLEADKKKMQRGIKHTSHAPQHREASRQRGVAAGQGVESIG
jgi:hypothetical protein